MQVGAIDGASIRNQACKRGPQKREIVDFMQLYVFGFLLDSSEDDSLKFQFEIDSLFDDQILQLLGHRSLNAMAEGDWPLSSEQVTQLSSIIGQPLPADLKLLIGVVA